MNKGGFETSYSTSSETMIRRCKFPRKVAAHEAIGRLPKAPVAGRVFGAALEYFACSVLLILGDVLGLVDGAPKASSAANTRSEFVREGLTNTSMSSVARTWP